MELVLYTRSPFLEQNPFTFFDCHEERERERERELICRVESSPTQHNLCLETSYKSHQFT